MRPLPIVVGQLTACRGWHQPRNTKGLGKNPRAQHDANTRHQCCADEGDMIPRSNEIRTDAMIDLKKKNNRKHCKQSCSRQSGAPAEAMQKSWTSQNERR